MHANDMISKRPAAVTMWREDIKSRGQQKLSADFLDTADEQASDFWQFNDCRQFSRLLRFFNPFCLSVQDTSIRRAVDSRCHGALELALAYVTSKIATRPVSVVSPSMVDKKLRMQILVAIGRAAAAKDVEMLGHFVRHGFVSRVWMGPYSMDCAASWGCLQAVDFMVAQARAHYQDAQEALYARRQPRSKSLYECTYKLDKAIAKNAGSKMFSLE